MSEVFNFDDGNNRFEVRLRRDDNNGYSVIIKDHEDNEKEITVTAKVLGAGLFQFTLDNIIYKCSVAKDGDLRFIHLDGADYELRRITGLEEEEFGDCVKCGEFIGLGRLRVDPAAPCCVKCAD